MKKIILSLLTTSLIMSGVSAGNETYSNTLTNEYKTAVIDSSLDFQAERKGYEVELSWNAYTDEDFQYYKVMKSTTNSNPIYPEQSAIGVLDNQQKDNFFLKDWNESSAYYRVCVISKEKSRTCSNVVKLEGFKKETKTNYTKETTEKKYDTKKEEVEKQPVKQVIKKGLDKNLQTRADQIVKNMITRLDKNMGDDNQAKIENLRTLNVKLTELKSKIKSEKTIDLIEYLVESLEKQIEQYSTSSDIEEIFKILGE